MLYNRPIPGWFEQIAAKEARRGSLTMGHTQDRPILVDFPYQSVWISTAALIRTDTITAPSCIVRSRPLAFPAVRNKGGPMKRWKPISPHGVPGSLTRREG